jgi:hypothetical protein
MWWDLVGSSGVAADPERTRTDPRLAGLGP